MISDLTELEETTVVVSNELCTINIISNNNLSELIGSLALGYH